MSPQFSLVCKKIFALMLSEGLLLYDYRTNGSLSSRETIRKWYYRYFRDVLGDSLNRSSLADNLARDVSQIYGPTLYEKVEKPIIEGRSPAVIIKQKGQNEDLDIEGIPSVVKGSKQLRDIFEDTIKDFTDKQRDKYYIDNYTLKDINTFTDEFGEFGEFLYKNRDINLLPDMISSVPVDPTTPFEKRASIARKDRERELEDEKEEETKRSYEAYLEKHPELQKSIKEYEERKALEATSKSRAALETMNQTNEKMKAIADIQTKALKAFGDLFCKS